MVAKKALGRGLKALIPDTPRARAGLLEIPVDHIRPNPKQPRHNFDREALEELASSLRRHGVLQPVLVSEEGQNSYLLITGERRWRAAKLAGLETLPVVVREHIEDSEQLELALVENLQRRDLTPLEEARAFEEMRLNLGLSQSEIGRRVGMDRSTVANAIRLLKLPENVQAMVEEGSLAAGHARALLAFADVNTQSEWASKAAATGLSVRDLERAAAEIRKEPRRTTDRSSRQNIRDPNLVAAAEKLALKFGTRVEICPLRRGGKIVISCSDQSELMRVFDLLMGGG